MPAEDTDAFDELESRYADIVALQDADNVLAWDQEVMMPAGGTPARSKQRSIVSTLEHDLLTDGEIESTLADLEADSLAADQQAVVREIRRVHDRQQAVPRDLIAARSETSSEALEVWQEARAEDDFSIFEPMLERQVDLARKYAAAIDPDRDPYAVLFEEYEPYLGLETAERVLTELREALVPRIESVRESDVTQPDPFTDPVPAETQEALARDALDFLGYDWDRGRLDTAPHPFSTGTQYDARVTTRFDESEPLSSLLSTIHEFGHARYTLGLPEAEYGSPLGQNRGLTVHESQSRLWENHVGRSRAFWDHFTDRVADRIPAIEEADAETLYRAVNRVDPNSLIRVESDELTYHLHIVLRFEIERALIDGDLKVSEVPAVWNDKMEEYLGIWPETASEGALQDIHWSHGDFGYFPTYSLGSVLAAQLFETARAELPQLAASIAAGEPSDLAVWLEGTIHRQGRRFPTGELIERTTGQSLTVDPFIEYVDAKFGDLYGF
ncbi:MAG: carboxypeptidase M32 [Halodesulfurarchaeum sp.]